MNKGKFLVSTLVDFPDDCSQIVFTKNMVSDLIDKLHWMGVRRVYWNFVQKGIWPWFFKHADYSAPELTIRNVGDPMLLACQLAHELGMEFYAVIKPFETGLTATSPPGSDLVADDPGIPAIGGSYHIDEWTKEHLDFRVRSRKADVPVGLEHVPVTRIQLRQKDMSDVRIKAENLQIWTSDDNTFYRRKDVEFSVTESLEISTRDVMDINGVLVSKQGDKVRALDLTGFELIDKFIVVTTDFNDIKGTFQNTQKEMIRVFGQNDEELPIVVASHKASWRAVRDFRTGDLHYDGGLGDHMIALDVSNQLTEFPNWNKTQMDCRDGVIGFSKGRNEYLSGSMCEAYPEVQDYWLSWVNYCMKAGVDGIDFRISNHSCWTDWPDSFGFNDPVNAEYKKRYKMNPDIEDFDPRLFGDLRGEFFDQFLFKAKQPLSNAGKSLQLHLEVESFRDDACQARWRSRPGNINFHWRDWLRSGLADEVTLFGRGWGVERVLGDPLALEMINESVRAGIPVHLSKQVIENISNENDMVNDAEQQANWLEQAYMMDGIDGYTYYETASFLDGAKNGKLMFRTNLMRVIRDRVYNLDLLN